MTERDVPKFTEAYHIRQWETCYESTRCFFDFLEREGAMERHREDRILDLCCGSGANLFWLKKRHPKLGLVGVDIVPELVEFGNKAFHERGMSGVELATGDVYALGKERFGSVDGVIAIQAVSWLPDEVGFLDTATSLDADWIALTGLMMPGSRTFRTLINDHNDPDHGGNYYNTFSIDYLKSLLSARRYSEITTEPFHIGVDLAKPDEGSLGTYTETTKDNRRLQISGALLMNWHFMLARRKRE